MDTALFTANNIWMMVSTALVFFMHLGFSFLEIGLTRQKNTINILFKNIFIICAGLLLYYVAGFNLMYPGDFNGYLGFAGFGLPLPENGLTPDYASGGYTYWTDFLFQGMFAATAATIVSGAVAERVKLGAFMIFTIIYVGIVYPIVGSWQWGGGFLTTLGGENGGFYDFAGSTLVHSVGGWAALIAIFLLGPRIGKFGADGKINAIPGHNIPLATAGVLILWLGWFGFNGGSVLSADPGATSLVLVTTSLAAAAGGFGAFILSAIRYKNYDLTMFLNGILGGLVGITAGADQMSPNDAVMIGLIAGAIIVLAVALIDRLRLDDPVGAVAVHLICGIFGTLAVGLFGAKAGMDQFIYQLTGVGIVGAFCVASAWIILFTLKKTIGLRVSKQEELEGLDLHEHGMDAYSDFRMNQH
ncbi:MAG: ammonium transporter [Flavobacteriaceae bacterium]|nr:ammonium transporter [Flavobacteriaceae bacterium]MDP4673966.1 ammonium transporter [Flavobacteriaceae bacterium]MDP4754752.1 ammonium transporter [Flavobacteriaceae bacterium]MDP4794503.1 ammonium transporter [Flavobacteriaceae bacterium]MDP4885298.1 ammonium transporter [Flavobacteriaceae bacterium]